MEEKEYYFKAREYLISFDSVTEEMLDREIDIWKTIKPKSLDELFKAFLNSAKNKQSMPNSIGCIEKLSPFLFGFNHVKVRSNYDTWEELFDAIYMSDYSPPGKMDKSNNKSHWVMYCQSIMSISEFLATYNTLEEFEKFVDGFLTNEQSKLALPLLLKEEIFGFGFALACNFLKENVSPEFIKPDTHINKIAQGLGITKSNKDFQIFKDVVAYCSRIGEKPYAVDKVFWLVGSGDFGLSNVKVNTSKEQFLSQFLN